MYTMRGWPRCSYVAEAAGDPLEGSAPPAQRWLLIEHRGPWGRTALTESGLDSGAVAALSRWAATENARLVLVRRPGRRPRAGPAPRWFRVDSRQGHESIRGGEFGTDAELAAAATDAGERIQGPLHLVCTHGRHDPCCAVRGRLLATGLAAADPEHTWECSHIGGCRFAPVMVLLPHGYVLGHVPLPAAVEAVRDYRNGIIRPRWLRGRSSLPPVAQAAQQYVRAATGVTEVDALRVVAALPDGTGAWHVTLAAPDCTVRLRERRIDARRPLTCAATSPGWIRVFDLVELRT